MNSNQKKSFASYLLIFLHFFLGIGALFGGFTLSVSPDGSLLRMPLSVLDPSPFNNFLIPGLILFFVLGVAPIITAIYLISKKPLKVAAKFCIYKDMHWAWNSSLYLGFGLIIWITVQVYMIQGILFIHVFYIFLGLIIQAVTILPSVQKDYSITK